MSKLIPCPRRIVVDGRLVAFKGQLITEEQAAKFGIAEPCQVPESEAPEATTEDSSVDSPQAPEQVQDAQLDREAAARELIARKTAEIEQSIAQTEPRDAAEAGGAE